MNISAVYMYIFSGLPIAVDLLAKGVWVQHESHCLCAVTEKVWRLYGLSGVFLALTLISAMHLPGISPICAQYYDQENFARHG